MKARKLIQGASFDPSQLKAIGKAFDDAWEQISPSVSKRAQAIEAARLQLANIILGFARDGVHDPEKLTDAAVEAMYADPTQL